MFDLENYLRDFFDIPTPAALPLWGKEYSQMIVHTQKASPRLLINGRRPHEGHQVMDYRIATYEPITNDSIRRAIDHLQQIIKDSNISIETSDMLTEYRNGPNFIGQTLTGYINQEVVPRMIDDPNGLLIWFPDGEGLQDPTQRVDVKPFLLLSENIHHLTKHVVSWLSAKKSPVRVGDEIRMEGNVYFIVTENEYIKRIQIGKKEQENYEDILLYQHNLGFLPAVLLGGIPSMGDPEEVIEFNDDGSPKRQTDHQHNGEDREELDYFCSYFSSFVPWGNEAIRQFSDHQAIMVTSAFPIREMKEEPCPNKGQHQGACHNGFVKNTDGNDVACHVCNGKGYIMPSSPYGIILTGSKDTNFSNEKPDNRPALRYITPDVDILDYSGKHWKDLLEKGEKALNQVFTDHAQSGKAKEIDREDRTASLDKIGHNIIRITKQSLAIIQGLRFRDINTPISIMAPPTFHQRTVSEVLEELQELQTSNAPTAIKAEVAKDVFKKRFPQNPRLHKVIDLVAAVDVLFGLALPDINMMLASGGITEREQQVNLKAYSEAVKLSEQDGFMAKSMDQLANELLAAIV